MAIQLLPLDHVVLDRMVQAVQRVRERLLRATKALENEEIPYAIIGGNAVAVWVARVDPAAVRNTADVDILLQRNDLEAASVALAKEGFIRHEVNGIDMFLDGPTAGPREALHVIFAGEKIRPDYQLPAPDITDSEPGEHYRVLSLSALVRMKLTSNRDKDRTHLRDFIEVGLIDASWVSRFPAELGARLQHILDTPDG